MDKKPWSLIEIAFVRSSYEEGRTDAEIAIDLSRTPGAVSNCRQAHSIRRPRATLKRAPEWSQDELALAQTMYSRGANLQDIAETTGRSRIALKRLVTERGLTRDLESCVQELSKFATSTEQWRHVGANPLYAVSSLGRVLSLQPGRQGNILEQWEDGDKYKNVTLQIDAKTKRHAVHRIVALAFLGDPPSPDHQVAHGDGDPSNNTVVNLRWATPKENQSDRLLHGTAARGEGGRFVPSR